MTTISASFQQIVAAGSTDRVKSALIDYMIMDKSFQKFDVAFQFAQDKMDLLEPFDEGPLEQDVTKWDKDYLNMQKVELLDNFAMERIDHVKQIIQKVLGVATPAATTPIGAQKKTNPTNPESRTGRKVISRREVPASSKEVNVKKIAKVGGTTLLAGGVVVTAVGITIAEPVVTTIGVAAIGVGVVSIIAGNH
ncbi:hypothetical protein [Lapidilactobacillus luobeiensis]|uniref:hypothetical protein n=1 Tax=Lapidilactobacillus luobeiensis TaxID=2950371 RepID=UPI0021C46048|nr:hypothetical protein [Lapidilactobacillus luobeiensis]